MTSGSQGKTNSPSPPRRCHVGGGAGAPVDVDGEGRAAMLSERRSNRTAVMVEGVASLAQAAITRRGGASQLRCRPGRARQRSCMMRAREQHMGRSAPMGQQRQGQLTVEEALSSDVSPSARPSGPPPSARLSMSRSRPRGWPRKAHGRRPRPGRARSRVRSCPVAGATARAAQTVREANVAERAEARRRTPRQCSRGVRQGGPRGRTRARRHDHAALEHGVMVVMVLMSGDRVSASIRRKWV